MAPPDEEIVFLYDPGNFTPYSARALAAALAARGAAVSLIASPSLTEETAGDQQVVVRHLFYPGLASRRWAQRHPRLRQLYKALAYASGVRRTRRLLESVSPGVFHIQWSPAPSSDAGLCRWLRARGWRVLYSIEDPLLRNAAGSHARLMHAVDAIVTHTKAQAEALAALQPAQAHKIYVIPHGVSAQPPASAEERRQARLRLHLPDQKCVLLFFGPLKPGKGLDDLIDAVPELQRAVPDAYLVIAGEARMPLPLLEDRIAARGLTNSIEIRPWFVPGEQMPDYFRAADLTVVPRADEAAPAVVLLAMSYGCPVAATSGGGLGEIITHDATGFLATTGEPEHLARTLSQALSDRVRLREIGQSARLRIEQAHDWKAVAARTFELYHALRGPADNRKPAVIPGNPSD